MVLVVKCLICNKELTYSQGDTSLLIAHAKFDHPNLRSQSKKEESELKREDKKTIQIVQTDLKLMDIMSSRESNSSKQKLSEDREKIKKNSTSDEEINTPFKNFEISALNAASRKDKKIEKSLYLDAISDANDMSFNHPKASSSPIMTTAFNNNATEKTPLFKKLKEKHHNDNVQPTKRKFFYKTSIEKWKPIGDMKIHCQRCRAYKRPIVKGSKEHIAESSIASAFFMACLPLYCSQCCFLPQPNYEVLHCSICDFEFGIYDHKKKMVFPNPHIDLEM